MVEVMEQQPFTKFHPCSSAERVVLPTSSPLLFLQTRKTQYIRELEIKDKESSRRDNSTSPFCIMETENEQEDEDENSEENREENRDELYELYDLDGKVEDILPEAIERTSHILPGLRVGKSKRRRMEWEFMAHYYRFDSKELTRNVRRVVRKSTEDELVETYRVTLDKDEGYLEVEELKMIVPGFPNRVPSGKKITNC
ncbi:hypothetical protein TKK_0008379 [Trichogramma kaykai]